VNFTLFDKILLTNIYSKSMEIKNRIKASETIKQIKVILRMKKNKFMLAGLHKCSNNHGQTLMEIILSISLKTGAGTQGTIHKWN